MWQNPNQNDGMADGKLGWTELGTQCSGKGPRNGNGDDLDCGKNGLSKHEADAFSNSPCGEYGQSYAVGQGRHGLFAESRDVYYPVSYGIARRAVVVEDGGEGTLSADPRSDSALPSDYAAMLAAVKERVRSAQYAALKTVNKE